MTDKVLVQEQFQKQLEEWTGYKCGEVIFNSDVDSWAVDTSVLNERIIGKRRLVFFIEDTDGEVFGYYLNTEIAEGIDIWESTDDKSFHFNLQSKNNRLEKPMKFEIIDFKTGGYVLKPKDYEYDLITIGDIFLYKENNKGESTCEQENLFDYHGIENALCGKTRCSDNEYFTPKRILVIQMEISEEQKQAEEKEREEQKQRKMEREEKLAPILAIKHQRQLEQWTGLQCGEFIFDSNVDSWEHGSNLLNERILGKKQLAFIIEGDGKIEGEIFGYYCNTEIRERSGWTPIETDYDTFLFNLQSKDNRLEEPMKFAIRDTREGAYRLCGNAEVNLITLGEIELYKQGWRWESRCYQCYATFRYNDIERALCGKADPEKFGPKRILVLQMID